MTSTFATAGIPERPLTFEQEVGASPDDVFAAFTDGDEISDWLGVEANVELRIGGPFEILFVPEAPAGLQGSEGCRILSYLPGQMLSFSWNSPPTETLRTLRGQHTWVVITFAQQGDGTRVRLVHTGMGSGEIWDGNRDYFTAAWPRLLAALAQHFE